MEHTTFLDVDAAGLDDCPLLGCGWARLRFDLLGRRCSVSSSSSSSKYAAQSQSLVDRFTVRRLISIWSIRYLIIFLKVGSALNFSLLGARTLRSAKTSGLCIKQLMTNMWMDIISTSPTALKASVKFRNEILAVVFAFVCGDRSCMLLLKFLACPSFSLSMRFFFWQSILFKPLAIL